MEGARGASRVFTDADLASPVAEIAKIVHHLEGGSDVAIACRVLPESRYLMSPSFFSYLYTRHVLSRVFNRVVRLDRKSTRLNSSHLVISYAVFCLKKKKKERQLSAQC